MNISKNIIRDLLPAYAAGEASVETCALIDGVLAEDPELRDEIRELQAVPSFPEPSAPTNLALSSLKRTQSLLRKRTFLVGFCYFFTTLTFAFVDRPGGLPFKLAATACLATGIAGWIEFLRNAVRLRDTGLQPRHSRWPQFFWHLGAWCILTAFGLVLYDWTHWSFLDRHAGMLIGLAMPLAYIGQWLKQYKDPKEMVQSVDSLLTLARREDPDDSE